VYRLSGVCVFRHECERVHGRVCACSGMSVSVFMHECERVHARV